MKPELRILLACLALLLPLVSSAQDKLVSVDPASGLITVDQRGALKSFRAKKFTEVIVNDTKATLQQLRPGMLVTLSLSDAQTASKIVARGNAAPPPPTSGQPAGTNRRIVLKLRVDGADIIKIGGGRLWIVHDGAKRPIDISVNGIKWEPNWDGAKSEPFTGFVPGLAPFAEPTVSVKQTKGRGQTTVVEPPTAENQQILSCRIQDGGNGADDYELRITW
jgi:hypothetical protein